MCVEWTVVGHSEGEDAVVSVSLSGFSALFGLHIQAGGYQGAVPGDHARSDGQHGRERSAVHVLWLLPGDGAASVWPRQKRCPQVSRSWGTGRRETFGMKLEII